jgi:hypothetical protein
VEFLLCDHIVRAYIALVHAMPCDYRPMLSIDLPSVRIDFRSASSACEVMQHKSTTFTARGRVSCVVVRQMQLLLFYPTNVGQVSGRCASSDKTRHSHPSVWPEVRGSHVMHADCAKKEHNSVHKRARTRSDEIKDCLRVPSRSPQRECNSVGGREWRLRW